MKLLVVFVFGLLVGSIFTQLIIKREKVGTLLIDVSQPEDPSLLLELSKDVGYIYKKKYVTVRVRGIVSNSRK